MSQEEFQQRANTLGGPDTTVTNRIDDTAPSQAFTFVSSYQLGTGAHLPGDEFLIGCECIGKYSRDGGCQAPSTCECLHQAVGRGEENVKLFPYLGPNTQRPGCLIPFYLESRHPIFECNKRCTCGPKCKNRVVQQGRKVKLDIFKTHNRGWGLRAREDIKKGQFVDVYIGELLREPAAKAREEFRTGKDSFLFTLDKFRSDPDFDEREILIVDGEFYGNATRFMNHSCEPNCRQFAVILIPGLYCYTLAFFAKRDIPMYEELTFDYLDPEEDEPIDLDEIDLEIREPCLCGSHQCRKWLWS